MAAPHLVSGDFYFPPNELDRGFKGRVEDGRTLIFPESPLTSVGIVPMLESSYQLFWDKYQAIKSPKASPTTSEKACTNACKIVGAATAAIAVPIIGSSVALGCGVISPACKKFCAASKDVSKANADLNILSSVNLILDGGVNEQRVKNVSKEAFKAIAENRLEMTTREKRCRGFSLLSKTLLSIAAVVLVHALVAIVVYNALAGSAAIFSSPPLMGLFVVSAHCCSGPIWIAISAIGGVGLIIGIALRCYNKKKTANDLANATNGLVRIKQLELMQHYPKKTYLWQNIRTETDLKAAIANQRAAAEAEGERKYTDSGL